MCPSRDELVESDRVLSQYCQAFLDSISSRSRQLSAHNLFPPSPHHIPID